MIESIIWISSAKVDWIISSLFIHPPSPSLLRFALQGVKPEKKTVDGKQVEDYWASSKKVCMFSSFFHCLWLSFLSNTEEVPNELSEQIVPRKFFFTVLV